MGIDVGSEAEKIIDRLQARVRELQAERDAAIEALERYGSHDDDCDYITTPVFDGRKDQVDCSCGFRVAARLQQKEQQT
jgi:hypothetical protein